MTLVRSVSSEETTRDCVKCPTFDGKDENWPFCKTKMESHLARLELSELLSENASEIPKDDEKSSDAVKQTETEDLRQKNRKAAGTSLNSILCESEKGYFYLAAGTTLHLFRMH